MNSVKQKNFYELLGVSKEATTDEIRKAYRKLAHELHPDKTGGDEAAEDRLKEINEAYDVLKNSKKRKEYDSESNSQFAGYDDFNLSRQAGFGPDFADILGSMFARGAHEGYATRRPGNDLEIVASVTLSDVASGLKKRISVSRAEFCGECRGSGAAAGSSPEACPDCGGAGQLFQSGGLFRSSRTCPNCHGAGKIIPDPCVRCGGAGRVQVTRELEIDIPAGINEGTRLRLAGEGEAGDAGAPRGDLYVRVRIETDPFFKRKGNDLLCEVPITFAQAALGAQIRVPTLQGLATVTVPEGTQNGALLRLKGMGLPATRGLGSRGGQKGDELILVQVEVPRNLTKEQKRLLRNFDGEIERESLPLIERFKRLLAKLRGA